jgi:hypothetical protein
MSAVICGYIGGPAGDPNAQPVWCDYDQVNTLTSYQLSVSFTPRMFQPPCLNKSASLLQRYWPVAVPGVYRGESFANGLPNVCEVGECLLLHEWEWNVLKYMGVIVSGSP